MHYPSILISNIKNLVHKIGNSKGGKILSIIY